MTSTGKEELDREQLESQEQTTASEEQRRETFERQTAAHEEERETEEQRERSEEQRRETSGEQWETHEERQRRSPSPRQARRIRMFVAAFFMAAAAIVLVVRLSEQSSVLTLGVYGAALILCGVVIELSRRGRTRLGMWLLVAGLAAVAVADQLLRAG
ncbi:hypothetical protein [Streptomyces sp. 8N706]|uniref:hypothetical protein n=1 Tax=Streptomyces sp. 8N706 TaxID=3457416 RepID=UPI003FD6B305